MEKRYHWEFFEGEDEFRRAINVGDKRIIIGYGDGKVPLMLVLYNENGSREESRIEREKGNVQMSGDPRVALSLRYVVEEGDLSEKVKGSILALLDDAEDELIEKDKPERCFGNQ